MRERPEAEMKAPCLKAVEDGGSSAAALRRLASDVSQPMRHTWSNEVGGRQVTMTSLFSQKVIRSHTVLLICYRAYSFQSM